MGHDLSEDKELKRNTVRISHTASEKMQLLINITENWLGGIRPFICK